MKNLFENPPSEANRSEGGSYNRLDSDLVIDPPTRSRLLDIELALIEPVSDRPGEPSESETGPETDLPADHDLDRTLSPNSIKVLNRRYLKRDGQGKPIEHPLDMFRRVARSVAEADGIYDPEADLETTETEFLNLMTSLDFMPNSPTLMNAGRELGQLSACFVLPVEDSMESIFSAIKDTALIHKSGGGTGFAFSRIRPQQDVVQSTNGVSSGPVSFMRVFDTATETIKQGGTRRGANMGVLRVDHPDIIDFIKAKDDQKVLNNFNLSVALTDAFMEAVERDERYALINPRTKQPVKEARAREIMDVIIKHAWGNGDPGVIFLDRINQFNPTPHIGDIESTNPCGEQPLLPYESCNLGSINLSRMVKPKEDGGGGIGGVIGAYQIDYDHLRRAVHSAVHFLDNVIDVNNYPLENIKQATLGNRKIGLGVMSFADMLIKLGIRYDSEEAAETAGELMSFITREARNASRRLAESRGNFLNFKGSIFDRSQNGRMRNATVTTIAPTGTLSIIVNTSSGIEPIFAVVYTRQNILDDDQFLEIHPLFEEVARKEGFYSESLMKRIASSNSIQEIEAVPEEVRNVFLSAHDISPECHVRIQAAFQRYTDNAVSKTVNFPHQATIEDVRNVYWLAYKSSLKGITIYRDGSRDKQVLSVNKEKKSKLDPAKISPRSRPSVTTGVTERIGTGCGHLYVTMNEDPDGLCEVFARMGKSGGCAATQSEAVSRLVSLALRSGINIDAIIKQLRGIRCPFPIWQSGTMVLSCPDAIGLVMKRYQDSKKEGDNDGEEAAPAATVEAPEMTDRQPPARKMMITCPECDSPVEFESGCIVCRSCGYSKCQ